MKRPILYSDNLSSPCRSVLLTIEAIGLDVEIREVNMFKLEQRSEEFQKMNPQHTIPTLDDNGFILWDSHAINCYLVQKYGKDDSLYPKDFQKRAIIDQRMYFETGVVFILLRSTVRSLFMGNMNPVDEDKITLANEAYDFVNKFLEGKKWLVGDSFTLADITCAPSISSLNALVPLASYPNIVRWLKTCEDELPGYSKINELGIKRFEELRKFLLSDKAEKCTK